MLGFKQIIKQAIRIEKMGETFYRKWAEKLDDPEHKKFFIHMADEEVAHAALFERLEETTGSFTADIENYEFYDEYLRSFADNLFNEETQKAEADKVKTLEDAIQFAMRRELDTILFYQEISPFVSDSQELQIKSLINEEREHYKALVDFKNSI